MLGKRSFHTLPRARSTTELQRLKNIKEKGFLNIIVLRDYMAGTEKTLVIVKPDGVDARLIGEVIKRLENKNLRIANVKFLKITQKQSIGLYGASMKIYKNIKKSLIDYITGGYSLVLIMEGKEAIKRAREVRGLSDPSKSPRGTVRRDYAGSHRMEELTKKGKATKNIMHSSGNKEEADAEIKLFFKKNEI